MNNNILCKYVFKEDISRKKFIQTVCKKLSENMPGISPEDKDILDKPPCKVPCVAEKSATCYILLRKCKNRTTNNSTFCQQHIRETHAKTYCPFCSSKKVCRFLKKYV